ncbi:MAG: TIGR01777 family oxidoreductase [Verrucomicrobia bacterium]|nr:TIGR01777 family oxidoreductase [Verrucomicrobiota bacterium]
MSLAFAAPEFSAYNESAMKVGITGASGFIGRHLVRRLGERGHEPVAFSRDTSRRVAGCRETRAFGAGQPVDLWDLDAVVNLAGEPILGLWTKAKRARILESRVGGTERIVQALAQAPRDNDADSGPRILINGSATGFYGDRGDEILEEDDGPGSGFLSEVCQQWESAACQARGVRVALVRIGFVLGQDGGAWPFLRRIFRLGLGGKLGGGQQWMSVIHVADVVGLIVALLEHEDDPRDASGPFNAVCPTPVRNVDFTRAVAAALHRPALWPAPAGLLKKTLGDLSHLLLDSQRIAPARTRALGYEFQFPNLAAILADVTRA